MIKASLHAFVDRVLDAKRITEADVGALRQEVLKDGLTCREEADVLIALDRAVPDTDGAWATYLVSVVVAFVLANSRTKGSVDQDTARWLVTSLGCGSGPTATAKRVAFEAVRSARQVDEELLTFVMRDAQRGRAIPAAVAA